MMQSLFESKVSPTPSRVPSHAVLQRQCACGKNHATSGECEECRQKKDGIMQRSPFDQAPVKRVPAIVDSVLRSSGQPLDARTRLSLEPRFGHDFSRVQVHTDARAAESAEAVNALAYTVGNHIVFAPGQYDPHSGAGQRLMVHELTHVAQQARAGQGQVDRAAVIGPTGGAAESEAADNAARAGSPQALTAGALASSVLQRQASPIDAAAQAIIDAAANTTVPIATRAPDVVLRIINQYYATSAAKISSIVYDQATVGLSTTYTGPVATRTGIITVGDQFVNGTTRTHFARRVAQVGHEIEHVDQQRAGMAGANRSDEREFLAFYHEALFVEKPGTGRIQHAMRVTLIDAALGYYYCLSSALQTQYDSYKQALLTRRATEASAGGNTPTPAPTTCRRQ